MSGVSSWGARCLPCGDIRAVHVAAGPSLASLVPLGLRRGKGYRAEPEELRNEVVFVLRADRDWGSEGQRRRGYRSNRSIGLETAKAHADAVLKLLVRGI